jgi:class 3 adenylate cyclase
MDDKQNGAVGYLVVNPDTPDAYFVELEDGKILEIGRKPSTSGQRKLVLPIPEVSGVHAELRDNDGWKIRDLGSTNGTRLNGEWLSPGQDHRLKNGDLITIASIDLLVNLPIALDDDDAGIVQHTDEHEKTQFHIKLINATILVGDIRSFTSLTEQYSDKPEMVMKSAHKVFQTLSGEVRKHHGQLEKIAGDAIMAYWQGDDSPGSESNMCAYQACYTALQMKKLVGDIAKNKDLWPFPDWPLHVDVALATGPVAAGVLGSAKANPALLGDTANLAFRLEKLIGPDAPGDIVLDGSTYELIKTQYDVESLGAVTVKGRQRPVDLYRLLKLKK